MTYLDFLRSKIEVAPVSGFTVDPSALSPVLKPHQRDAVVWALAGGRRALFESFGLGKTLQELEYCRLVLQHEGGKALIVLPLGVRQEFRRDAVQLLGMEERLELDYICLGGEAMVSPPQCRGAVFNGYGPTEFTVAATYYELEKGRKYDNIPIGRPLDNCAAYIVNDQMELLPPGEIGELCLAGPQMAEGYWNRPELTAQKFTTLKLTEDESVRIYRTGDLACWNDEGQLEFCGRIDTQVKLRGFRVELGEVESRAARYPGIRQTAAEVRNNTLCLYYTAS